jgi:hypothetical protein
MGSAKVSHGGWVGKRLAQTYDVAWKNMWYPTKFCRDEEVKNFTSAFTCHQSSSFHRLSLVYVASANPTHLVAAQELSRTAEYWVRGLAYIGQPF